MALLFSTFEVTTQSFYRSALSYAIVNLKPVVPGRKPQQLSPKNDNNHSYRNLNQMCLSSQTDPFPGSRISMVFIIVLVAWRAEFDASFLPSRQRTFMFDAICQTCRDRCREGVYSRRIDRRMPGIYLFQFFVD